jgi:hypothetical protein
MEAPERRVAWKPAEGRSRLALWILAPALGLVALVQVVAGLEGVECGEGGGASDLEVFVVVTMTAVFSLAAIVGAAVRLLALRRSGRAWVAHRTVLSIGIGAVLLSGIVFALAASDAAYFLLGACLAGMALTGIALVGLLVAWFRGAGVAGSGGLLPLYLLGAGLFTFPILLLLAAIGQSGVGC